MICKTVFTLITFPFLDSGFSTQRKQHLQNPQHPVEIGKTRAKYIIATLVKHIIVMRKGLLRVYKLCENIEGFSHNIIKSI